MDPESEWEEADRDMVGADAGCSSAPRSSAPAIELMLPPRFLFSRTSELWVRQESVVAYYDCAVKERTRYRSS